MLRSEKLSLTVPAEGTSVSATTKGIFSGRVVKVEIDPGAAMATNATLKVYQADTPLATGTRDHYLNYIFPASQVELVVYPTVLTTLNTAAETTATYDGTRVVKTFVQPVVNGPITADLASAVAADATAVWVFVEE